MDPSNEFVLGAQVLWADFDGNAPQTWDSKIVPVPTLEVQSSTQHKRHVYWALNEFVTDKKALEDRNRAIAYALGADPSGWDANQFLRPPFSVNRKYDKPIMAKVVEYRQDLMYEPVAFGDIPSPKEAIETKIDLGTIPTISEVLALAKWDRDTLAVFNRTFEEMSGPDHDRSGALQRLAHEGAEKGWSDEQIMAVLLDADDRWQKYSRRATRERILVDLINRARARHGYSPGDFDSLLNSLVAQKNGSPEEAPDDDEWVLSLGDIADLEDIDDWVVEDLLIPRGVGLITGRPGVGKTQLAFQFAADISTGRSDFLKWGIPDSGKRVLFMSLEMSNRQLRYLARPIKQRYPENTLSNLMVWAKGDPLALDEEPGQLYFLQLLERYKPEVVMIDSLSLMIGGDLTDDKAVKPAFDFLKKARNKYDFSVIMVHHHRKKANDAASRRSPNTQSDIYGSYYITAQIDFALDLEVLPEDVEPGQITMSLLKNRYSAPMDPIKIMRNDRLAFNINELDADVFGA
jgi:archaellum biogenesis ATPase FlaH